jgi:hypothetical protein
LQIENRERLARFDEEIMRAVDDFEAQKQLSGN